VDPPLKELIDRVAKARGEQISNFVRRAVKTELARLSYLSPEEKKALGIQPDVEQDIPNSTASATAINSGECR